MEINVSKGFDVAVEIQMFSGIMHPIAGIIAIFQFQSRLFCQINILACKNTTFFSISQISDNN